jgi:hypothetical protein
MEQLTNAIEQLAETYSKALDAAITARTKEMEADDTSHYLVYRVLGITSKDGKLIDSYQNTGRFLYKYAGSFLEDAATLCLNYKFPDGIKTKVPNTLGTKPKTFEIDFLNGNDAIEVKWRDATTDGDHITKEHTRVKVISGHGYKPIRIMFYYPQRDQAKRIQETLRTLYAGVAGEYYGGDEAWDYLCSYAGVDLKGILVKIADQRTPDNEE